jgi:PTS system mannitol-specific IIA component
MSDVLTPQQVKVPGTATTKADAIREAGALLVVAGAVTEDYIDAMFQREESVSTYMGNYLAIPHGTLDTRDTILRSGISVVRYDTPIDWDGNEVRFVLGIAGANNTHLDILSKVAIVFSDLDQVEQLRAAPSGQAVFDILSAVNTD